MTRLRPCLAALLDSVEDLCLPCLSSPCASHYFAPCRPTTIALLQFSGGNQQEGPEGLPAAMAAARVNAGIPNQ